MANQDYTDLTSLKQQADEFFTALMAMVQTKNDRINELENQLKSTLSVINEIIAIKSDFALLKDKTTNEAKNLAQSIQDILAKSSNDTQQSTLQQANQSTLDLLR